MSVLKNSLKILVVGSGARENAIVKSLYKSKLNPQIYCFGSSRNPDIILKTADSLGGYTVGSVVDKIAVSDYAVSVGIDLAIVGADNPIEAGVGDELLARGIKISSPTKAQAQIEWSKTFTRNLLTKYNISGSPLYKSFTTMDGVVEFANSVGEIVIKADGLCGGKGVKVQGDHFKDLEEGLIFCREIVNAGGTFLIEEKLVGQEFSLFSFSDGATLVDMPIIQDHKRAFEGDRGPNTGGMGTYSDADGLLPFLTQQDKDDASSITKQVAKAIKSETGSGFVGIFYGGFMKTKSGIKLIEYNARFGDPEAMNLLTLLESDFVEINLAMATSTLDALQESNPITFQKLATVCKYVVPLGYPDAPVKGEKIDISGLLGDWDNVYFASVDAQKNEFGEEIYVGLGSRSIAICHSANTISQAEEKVEADIQKITGALFHRSDIGKADYIQTKVDMMNEVLGKN